METPASLDVASPQDITRAGRKAVVVLAGNHNLTPLSYASRLIMVRVDPIAPDRSRPFSGIYGLIDDIAPRNRGLDGPVLPARRTPTS